MRIGIDFDGTWDRDPAMWSAFAKMAHEAGHEVWCVTSREKSMLDRLLKMVAPVIGTDHIVAVGRVPKSDGFFMATGKRVDIWIDDQPELIRPLNSRPSGLIIGGEPPHILS